MLGQDGEQPGHGAMHLAYGEAPSAAFARDALDARERGQDLGRERVGGPFVDRELHHVLGPEGGHQLAWRSESNDLAMIQDGDPVAQAFGLLHVVGGEEHRPPARLQAFHDLPGLPPRLRIEAGRGLVQEEQLRVSDEGARQGQPLLLAARERAHLGVCLLFERHESQRLRDRQAAWIEAAEEREHLAHVQLVGELRLLELDAQPAAQGEAIAPPVVPEHLDLSGVGRPKPFEDLHRGRLARAVGPEHAETLGALHLEVEAGHGHHLAVTLDEAAATEGALGVLDRKDHGPSILRQTGSPGRRFLEDRIVSSHLVRGES